MTLGDMLLSGSTIYQAPLFQRRYVWGRKQFDQMWGDIQAVADGLVATRFLGAVVLTTGSAALPGQAKQYLIIDGQQRLTTLFLLIGAIAESAVRIQGGESLADTAIDAVINRVGGAKGRPKFEPTLQDRAQFHSEVSRLNGVVAKLGLALPINLAAPHGPPSGAMTKMSGVLRSALASELRALGKAASTPSDGEAAKLGYLSDLFGVLTNHLKFVGITLGSDDDPHQVFDRLNSAGIRLKVSDLVRNEVFERLADDPTAAEALANGGWQQFETDLGETIEDFVFTYGLIQNSGTTKGDLLRDLRVCWDNLAADEILADMRAFVPAFMAVAAGPMAQPLAPIDRLGKPLRDQTDRLRAMPIPSSVYPFATMVVKSASEGTLTEGEGQKTLKLVESFLVRRAFNGLEPTGLHALFRTAWDKTKGQASGLEKEIAARTTIAFPEDVDFAKDIQERGVYRMKLMPFVLRTYEANLRGDAVPLTFDLTIDHVMPQTLGTGWPGVSREDHDRLKHTWANLVPLTRLINSAKGNLPWAVIRSGLQKESIWKTPRVLAVDYVNWEIQDLEDRRDKLVAWALKQWPRTQ